MSASASDSHRDAQVIKALFAAFCTSVPEDLRLELLHSSSVELKFLTAVQPRVSSFSHRTRYSLRHPAVSMAVQRYYWAQRVCRLNDDNAVSEASQQKGGGGRRPSELETERISAMLTDYAGRGDGLGSNGGRSGSFSGSLSNDGGLGGAYGRSSSIGGASVGSAGAAYRRTSGLSESLVSVIKNTGRYTNLLDLEDSGGDSVTSLSNGGASAVAGGRRPSITNAMKSAGNFFFSKQKQQRQLKLAGKEKKKKGKPDVTLMALKSAVSGYAAFGNSDMEEEEELIAYQQSENLRWEQLGICYDQMLRSASASCKLAAMTAAVSAVLNDIIRRFWDRMTVAPAAKERYQRNMANGSSGNGNDDGNSDGESVAGQQDAEMGGSMNSVFAVGEDGIALEADSPSAEADDGESGERLRSAQDNGPAAPRGESAKPSALKKPGSGSGSGSAKAKRSVRIDTDRNTTSAHSVASSVASTAESPAKGKGKAKTAAGKAEGAKAAAGKKKGRDRGTSAIKSGGTSLYMSPLQYVYLHLRIAAVLLPPSNDLEREVLESVREDLLMDGAYREEDPLLEHYFGKAPVLVVPPGVVPPKNPNPPENRIMRPSGGLHHALCSVGRSGGKGGRGSRFPWSDMLMGDTGESVTGASIAPSVGSVMVRGGGDGYGESMSLWDTALMPWLSYAQFWNAMMELADNWTCSAANPVECAVFLFELYGDVFSHDWDEEDQNYFNMLKRKHAQEAAEGDRTQESIEVLNSFKELLDDLEGMSSSDSEAFMEKHFGPADPQGPAWRRSTVRYSQGGEGESGDGSEGSSSSGSIDWTGKRKKHGWRYQRYLDEQTGEWRQKRRKTVLERSKKAKKAGQESLRRGKGGEETDDMDSNEAGLDSDSSQYSVYIVEEELDANNKVIRRRRLHRHRKHHDGDDGSGGDDEEGEDGEGGRRKGRRRRKKRKSFGSDDTFMYRWVPAGGEVTEDVPAHRRAKGEGVEDGAKGRKKGRGGRDEDDNGDKNDDEGGGAKGRKKGKGGRDDDDDDDDEGGGAKGRKKGRRGRDDDDDDDDDDEGGGAKGRKKGRGSRDDNDDDDEEDRQKGSLQRKYYDKPASRFRRLNDGERKDDYIDTFDEHLSDVTSWSSFSDGNGSELGGWQLFRPLQTEAERRLRVRHRVRRTGLRSERRRFGRSPSYFYRTQLEGEDDLLSGHAAGGSSGSSGRSSRAEGGEFSDFSYSVLEDDQLGGGEPGATETLSETQRAYLQEKKAWLQRVMAKKGVQINDAAFGDKEEEAVLYQLLMMTEKLAAKVAAAGGNIEDAEDIGMADFDAALLAKLFAKPKTYTLEELQQSELMKMLLGMDDGEGKAALSAEQMGGVLSALAGRKTGGPPETASMRRRRENMMAEARRLEKALKEEKRRRHAEEKAERRRRRAEEKAARGTFGLTEVPDTDDGRNRPPPKEPRRPPPLADEDKRSHVGDDVDDEQLMTRLPLRPPTSTFPPAARKADTSSLQRPVTSGSGGSADSDEEKREGPLPQLTREERREQERLFREFEAYCVEQAERNTKYRIRFTEYTPEQLEAFFLHLNLGQKQQALLRGRAPLAPVSSSVGGGMHQQRGRHERFLLGGGTVGTGAGADGAAAVRSGRLKVAPAAVKVFTLTTADSLEGAIRESYHSYLDDRGYQASMVKGYRLPSSTPPPNRTEQPLKLPPVSGILSTKVLGSMTSNTWVLQCPTVAGVVDESSPPKPRRSPSGDIYWPATRLSSSSPAAVDFAGLPSSSLPAVRGEMAEATAAGAVQRPADTLSGSDGRRGDPTAQPMRRADGGVTSSAGSIDKETGRRPVSVDSSGGGVAADGKGREDAAAASRSGVDAASHPSQCSGEGETAPVGGLASTTHPRPGASLEEPFGGDDRDRSQGSFSSRGLGSSKSEL